MTSSGIEIQRPGNEPKAYECYQIEEGKKPRYTPRKNVDNKPLAECKDPGACFPMERQEIGNKNYNNIHIDGFKDGIVPNASF